VLVEAVNVPPVPRLPPMFIVPAPVKVNCACAAVPEKVMAPLVVTVPVETDRIVFRLAVWLPAMLMLVALNVPVSTARVLATAAVGKFIVMVPDTVRVFVPLIVMPLAVEAALMVTLRHDAGTSTVTVIPLLMVTASADVGTAEPPQVVVLLQLPLTEAVLAAPSAMPDMSTAGITRHSASNRPAMSLLPDRMCPPMLLIRALLE